MAIRVSTNQGNSRTVRVLSSASTANTQVANIVANISNVTHLRELEAKIDELLETQSNLKMVAAERMLIEDNQIVLSDLVLGDVTWNVALVFEDPTSQVVIFEAKVEMDSDRQTVHFDADDELNGLYATFSYLTTV